MKSFSSLKKELIGEEAEVSVELENLEEAAEFNPPTVLVLKRQAIRVYPNGTRIALYHNDKLNRYFSVPYLAKSSEVSPPDSSLPVQAEEFVSEEVMDTLHKIVKERQAQAVKFANGKTKKVDGFTASAMVQVHNALNDENKKKYSEMVHKSPEHFERARSFAFRHVK